MSKADLQLVVMRSKMLRYPRPLDFNKAIKVLYFLIVCFSITSNGISQRNPSKPFPKPVGQHAMQSMNQIPGDYLDQFQNFDHESELLIIFLD